MKRLVIALLVLLAVLAFATPAKAHHFWWYPYGPYWLYHSWPPERVVVVPQQPTMYVQQQAPAPTVISYPHGRYRLQGNQWVWIPNPPAPPPQPAAAAACAKYTGKFVKTAQGLQPECE